MTCRGALSLLPGGAHQLDVLIRTPAVSFENTQFTKKFTADFSHIFHVSMLIK